MKVAVVVAVRDEERFLRQAIQSVLDQRFDGSLHCIVVDDGSTDGTASILDEMAKNDGRVILDRTTGVGVALARNRGLEMVPRDTDFITFLDGDDMMVPGRLAADLATFGTNPAWQIVYSKLLMVMSEVMDEVDYKTHPFASVGVSLSAGLFRRQLVQSAGQLSAEFRQGEDLDYLLRCFEQSSEVHVVDRVAVLYRRHSENVTADGAALRRGVALAMLRHAQRRKANPALHDASAIWARLHADERRQFSVVDRSTLLLRSDIT